MDMSRILTRVLPDGTIAVADHEATYTGACDCMIEKLSYLERLQEQGRLIELLCAAGDTLFVIDVRYKAEHKAIREHKIAGVLSTGKVSNILNGEGIPIAELEDIGTTAFLTREQAKAALVAKQEK